MLVDLLLTDKRYYTFEGYAASEVSKVLKKHGIAHRHINLGGGVLGDYMASLQERRPTLTLSFTPRHKPLCDLMGIPHFYWDERGIVPVAKMTTASLKRFEVVLFADVTLDSVLPDVTMDVFGHHVGKDLCVHFSPKVRLHSALPYIEHFEVLKESKIVLADPNHPWYWPAVAAGCLPLVSDIDYYLSHSQERQLALEQLQQELPQRSWELHINQLMESMTC